MNNDQIELTLLKVKSFIQKNQINQSKFEELSLSLYRLHYEMNDVYYDFCNRKIPNKIEEIPLMPTSVFSSKKVGLRLETQMPFPGIKLNNGNSNHYMRDTELFKDSIAKSFPTIVLDEDTLVPWINFVGVYEKSKQDTTSYVLQYLSESFHGKVYKNLNDFKNFIKNLIEEEGDEVKIRIPTILIAEQKILKDIIEEIEKSSYEEAILPLGSKVIEIENFSSKNSLNISKKICDVFGINQISKALLIPEISSQMYASIKNTNIECCIKNNQKEAIEYFFSPWVYVRVLKEGTLEDVAPGEIGEIAIYDLANFWSCPFVRTNYYGKIGNSGGFIVESSNFLDEFRIYS